MTGSGAAQSLRPVCVARRERTRDGVWRRVRELNPRCGVENPASWPLDEHDMKTSTSAVPPREPSRRRRRLAARGQVFLPRTSRAAYTVSLCDDGVQGHTRSEREKQKARILCGIRASGIQSAAGVSVRHGCLPDHGDPRTRDGRVPAPSAGRSNTAGRRARTHGSRRGLGRCEGRSGCSRWVSWFVSVRSVRVGPARCVQRIIALPSDRTQCK